MNFENIVFVITGASKGIGKALAEILVGYGATVIGVYHKTRFLNTKVIPYKCDVTKEKEVQKMFSYLKAKYGTIHGLVNCAALSEDADIYHKDDKSFMRVVATNLLGTFLTCKYASGIMETGTIINLSSTDASTTYSPYAMDYAASKAGVENLTKNLAKRFPNLKVCALAPAWVDTEAVKAMDPKYLQEQMAMHDQERLLRKEEVAVKIIEMFINNDNYISGDIIIMNKADKEM